MSYALILASVLLAAPQGEVPSAEPAPPGESYSAPLPAAPLSESLDVPEGQTSGEPNQPTPAAAEENGQSLRPDDVRGESDDPNFPRGFLPSSAPGGLPHLSADLQTPLGGAPATAEPPGADPVATSPPAVEFSAGSAAGDALAPVRTPPDASLAEKTLRDLLAGPNDEPLAGDAVTLLDVLGGTSQRAEQSRLIAAYWKLVIQIGKYHAAQSALDRLTRMADGATPMGPDLAVAIAETRIDVETAHLAVVELQHDLLQERGALGSGALPLPVDRPHVGSYRTYFDSLFPGQTTGVARRINDTLPVRLAELHARAAGIAAARATAEQLAGGGGLSRSASGDAVAAESNLRRHEEAFLDTVLEYNLQIAQYVYLAEPEGTGGARLVSMLIKSDPSRSTAHSTTPVDRLNSVLIRREPTLAQPSGDPNSGVVPASGQSPLGGSDNGVRRADGASSDEWRRADDRAAEPLGTAP